MAYWLMATKFQSLPVFASPCFHAFLPRTLVIGFKTDLGYLRWAFSEIYNLITSTKTLSPNKVIFTGFWMWMYLLQGHHSTYYNILTQIFFCLGRFPLVFLTNKPIFFQRGQRTFHLIQFEPIVKLVTNLLVEIFFLICSVAISLLENQQCSLETNNCYLFRRIILEFSPLLLFTRSMQVPMHLGAAKGEWSQHNMSIPFCPEGWGIHWAKLLLMLFSFSISLK